MQRRTNSPPSGAGCLGPTMVTLDHPLFLGQVSGELGGVLEDEHKSYKVDVCEQLRNGWAALHRPGL